MRTVRRDLRKKGWSAATGSLENVRQLTRLEGLVAAPNGARSYETTLLPYETDKAPPRSLSAVYGLGAQPLHTDGAHLREPPDVIVLHSAEPTPTSTVVWMPPAVPRSIPVAAIYGVFSVRGNRESFLANAVQATRIRFDPVVMSPGDAYARETVEFFAEAREHAQVHQWDRQDALLFIDNRRALHARDEVTDAATRTITRLALRWKAEE